MKTIFPIKGGTLEFFDGHIEIRDKWKSARFQFHFLPMISLLYPLLLVFYRKEGEDMWWIGLVILLIGTFIIPFRFLNPKRRVFDTSLQIDQIDKVVMESYSYDRLSSVFYLKNGTRRFVDLDFDRFWRADFKQSLAEKKIACDLK